MEIRVRSRDSTADVRDEVGISDGFNAFVSDTGSDERTLEEQEVASRRASTLVEPPNDSRLACPTTPDSRLWPREKVDRDPNEVQFDGPDDPEDPLNYPTWRKWVIVVTIASASTCV